MKQVTSNTDSRFKSLFYAIQQNAEINALKQTLLYLNTAMYKADLDVLPFFFKS